MAKLKLNDGPIPKPPVRKEPFKGSIRKPLFDQLFPCSWKGVEFPVTSCKLSWAHGLAQHKYWGVDAADVEATGREPIEIEMQIPFVNGIAPGKNERWKQLYPTVFTRFLAEMNDTATGLLDTPEISGLVCKPVSIEFEHTGTIRDGVMCTARWIETQDELADPGKSAHINVADLEAINLDALSAQLPPDLPPDDISFEQLMNNITGVVDTIGSKITILANKPNQILYRIKRLRDSVERTGNALYWPVHDAAERLEEAVRELPKTPDKIQSQFNRRKVLRYTAQFRSTIPMLAALTSNSVDDIITLNPNLLSRPAVAPGTIVRYYRTSIPLG